MSNLSVSFRQNYSAFGGVAQYYERYGAVYRNPHEPIVAKLIKRMMEKWTSEQDNILHEIFSRSFFPFFSSSPLPSSSSSDLGGAPSCLRVLDLACGSGEAYIALRAWTDEKVRHLVAVLQRDLDQDQEASSSSPNDHSALHLVMSRLSIPLPDTTKIDPEEDTEIDPTSVSSSSPSQEGEETERVREVSPKRDPIVEIRNRLIEMQGTDPYTSNAFQERTGSECLSFSFKDIETGCFGDQTFDMIVSSFALHLLDKSELFGLCSQIAFLSPSLIVLTPHKRPEIAIDSGWELVDEILFERVRARLYRSLFFVSPNS